MIPDKLGQGSVSAAIKSRLADSPIGSSYEASNAVSHKLQKEFALSSAVSSKIEDGNIKAALRLLCSEDKPADLSDAVFVGMQSKHPPAATDKAHIPDPKQYVSLQVSENMVLQAIKSFPAGSSGGPDGFRPQHLADLCNCETGGPALLKAVTGFVNLILDGNCPPQVRPIFFGARLIAIEKKSGGLRPIAVGYILRRLVSFYAQTLLLSKP